MATAELDIIVKLKDMAKGSIKDLNTGLTGLGTSAAVAAGAGVAAITAGLMNIGDQASNARTVLQGLNDVDLESVLNDAQLLARRYGEDVNKTVAATRTLMEDFGLTSEEANDLIVSGFSRGLNASGDFLDSIGEYSNLFVDGGATAEEFFSLLESGLAGGVLGTDKAADAFKEFGIRLSELQLAEGDMTFAEALDGSGEIVKRMISGFESALYFTDLSAKEINDLHQGLMDGSKTTADAFKIIVPALAGIESEVERNAAGVQLFGTQWEDLGPQIMSQLTLTGTSMEQLGETAEAERGVILGSLGEVPALIFDKFSLALLPLSDLLLGVANSIMAAEDPLAQLLEEVFKLVPGLEQFAGQGTAIVAALQPFIKIVKDNLIPIIAGLVAVVGVALVAALVAVIAPIAKVILITGAFVAALFAAVAGGIKLVQYINTNFPQVGETIDRIFKTAQAVVRSVMMQIEATVATITEVIAEFWATYGDEIIATVNDLARQLGALWNDIYQLINAAMIGIGKVINNILKAIQTYWQTYGKQIQDFAIGVFRYVSQQISAFMTVIRGVVQTITALIRGDWQGVANGLRLIVNGIYNNIVTTFSAIWAVIGPPLTTIKNGIVNAISGAWNGITTTLTTIKNGIVNAISGAWNGITSNLANIKSRIISTITDAWNGITSNLANIKSRIVNAITDAWNGITSNLANIRSRIISTISDAWNGITSNLSNIRSRIISTITDAWNGITSNLANIKNRITSTITDAASAITTPLSDIKDDVIDAITSVKDWLSTFSLATQATAIANSLINGIKNGISNGLESIKTAFKDVVRNALESLPKPIRDALAVLGFRVTRSASAMLPAPPPTTRGAAVGSVLPGASVTAGSSPSIVINIGSVRDARDIDAIKRAVRDGMDEAARRGIVQSQLPRGI